MRIVKWEHYKIPTVQEISSELAGKTVFSTVDLKDGYWQVELDSRTLPRALLILHLNDTVSPECRSD